MAKQSVEVEVVGKDVFSPTAEKINANVDKMAAKFKAFGKASGFGDIGNIGETLRVGKVVGGSTDADIIGFGKIAGAVAGVEIAGRTLKNVGDGVRKTVQDVQSGTAGVGEAINENIIGKLPIIGTWMTGLQSVFGTQAGAYISGIGGIGQAINDLGEIWDEVTGRAEANAEATKTIAENLKVRASIKGDQAYDAKVGAVIQRGETPAAKIAREENEAIDQLQKDRAEKEAHSGILRGERLKDYEAAETQIHKEAADKRAGISDKIVADQRAKEEAAATATIAAAKETKDKIEEIQRETISVDAENVIAGMRRDGDDLEAAFAEITEKFAKEREATAKERQQIIDHPSDPETDARARNVLASRDEVTGRSETEAIIAAKASQAQRDEDAAEKIQRITRETIELTSDGDDKSAERQLNRIKVAEEYRQKELEITKALTDPAATDEQLEALENALNVIQGNKEAAIERAGRSPDQVVQGRQIAAAEDGRFTGRASAARSQIEVFRDASKHAAATAENTKAMREGIDKLLLQLTGGPVVG